MKRKALAAIIALPALIAALVVGGTPAVAAGGWAVTYLDPAPSRFEGGTSYALGFWVLQHGTHPFEGKMEPVGLRLTGQDGRSLEFKGTALPEAAHYLASVVVPEGVWKVEGVQGPFQPYEVGTLTVPGALRIKPVAPELVAAIGQGGHDYWGDVRPPGFEPGDGSAMTAGPAPVPVPASAPAAPVVAASPAARAGDPGGVPAYTLLLAAAGGAVVAWAALGLPVMLRRRREEQPDRPDHRSPEDTIVISG
ncbi:hypothetical protein [Nonomuraea sp. GTA35]|uniref:hypothetical protein n=1 Tax=Nonomuraea sp. GTA35 TaxID=1676746 RepID=UPI0035BFBC6A